MSGKSKFTPQQKAEVVLMGLREGENVSEICRKHNVSPISFTRWKRQYLSGGLEAMSGKKRIDLDDIQNENLKLKHIIGELYVELDYVKKKLEMGR